MENKNKIPLRNEVSNEDKWDLSKLFLNDEAWENGLNEYGKLSEQIKSFKGSLGNSAEDLLNCLEFMNNLGLLEERLGYYSQLKMSEDGSDPENQSRYARYMNIASKADAEASFMTPEIQSIPEKIMDSFLKDEKLKDFNITLNKILRYKEHVLSEQEEKLLAMQSESNQTAKKTFAALTDVDMEFGNIKTEKGEIPLSQGSFSSFLINPDRKVRKKAYEQFYDNFEKHKNTLASLYSGSVHLDVYRAKVRNYNSALEASLFPDKVELKVYKTLIQTVNNALPALHSYYELRRKHLKVDKLKHYDVYVPIVENIQVKHSYNEAVDLVIKSLAPLGEEYCQTLKNGLNNGWVDKYENKGKRSGAFSAGSYIGDPYILMNYKEDVLRDVFTLAHEGGHSMHSWYSVKNNPFQHYNYTIFEAEVASTFNEQLLADYLIKNSDSNEMKAYLIGKQIDDIVATVYRQTMFAEFEMEAHYIIEKGEALTLQSIRKLYRSLLEKYFGSSMELDEVSDLEALRIPHFYRAFYVYKYATGLSAAVTLAEKVLKGNEKDKNNYLEFLKSGGSKYPIESLKLAGVDMSQSQAVEYALNKFEKLVKNLDQLL